MNATQGPTKSNPDHTQPRMRRPDLKLDEPLEEEDISDGSPYIGFSLTSASSSASSSSVFSTPTFSQTPLLSASHITSSLTRKNGLGQLSSSSSSALDRSATLLPTRSPSLSRSQTLPRISQPENRPRKRQAELDGIGASSEVLDKLRRWIIGVAIGVFLEKGSSFPRVMNYLQLTSIWTMVQSSMESTHPRYYSPQRRKTCEHDEHPIPSRVSAEIPPPAPFLRFPILCNLTKGRQAIHFVFGNKSSRFTQRRGQRQRTDSYMVFRTSLRSGIRIRNEGTNKCVLSVVMFGV